MIELRLQWEGHLHLHKAQSSAELAQKQGDDLVKLRPSLMLQMSEWGR